MATLSDLYIVTKDDIIFDAGDSYNAVLISMALSIEHKIIATDNEEKLIEFVSPNAHQKLCKYLSDDK